MARGQPPRDRPRAARLLLLLGGVLLTVALGLTGVRLAVLDEGRFVAAAGTAIEQPAVATLVGTQISDQLVGAEPDLIAVQPVIQTAVTAAVASSAAQGLVRTAARQLHRTAVAGDPDTAVLRLGNVGLLAVQSLRTLSPGVAKRIPTNVDAALVSLDSGQAADLVGTVTKAARTLRLLSWLASGLALLLLAAAVLARRDRMSGLRAVGIAVAAAGAGTIVVHFVVRSVTVGAITGPESRDAGMEVYDAFLGGLVSLGTATIAVGLVLVVAVGALTRRESLTAVVRRRIKGIDADPRGRRVGAALGAGFGALLLLDRDLALRITANVAGITLLVVGLEALLRSGTAPEPEEERVPTEPAAEGHGPGQVRRLATRIGRRRGVVVAAVVLLGLVVIGGTTERALDSPRLGAMRCNGAARFCALRLDQVVLPSTHNSNAAAKDGFLLANQETGIANQLEGGIRGFLIDTHEGRQMARGVYTRLEDGTKSLQKIESSIGAQATRTALTLRRRLNGGGRGPGEVFLCHGFCELGAVRAVDSLRHIRDFLLAHPDEVVVLSVEDQTTPERFAEVVRESGLLDLIWTGPVNPLPTLGEMVRSGGRVLVLAEENAKGVPWIHPQFQLAQETPYDLQTKKALLGDPGCAVGRGGTTPPLLLVNHFLGTVPPRPSAAARVNDRAAILEQVARCRELRHRTANLLAVDFWKTGDVVGAARELNDAATRRGISRRN